MSKEQQLLFYVSEFGQHTHFDSVHNAIEQCKVKKLTDGENGLLWIKGHSREQMETWMHNNANITNNEYMRFVYVFDDVEWIWCDVNKEWLKSVDYFNEEL